MKIFLRVRENLNVICLLSFLDFWAAGQMREKGIKTLAVFLSPRRLAKWNKLAWNKVGKMFNLMMMENPFQTLYVLFPMAVAAFSQTFFHTAIIIHIVFNVIIKLFLIFM